MRAAIDHSALASVRQELDKVLQQGRRLLEDYDANPDAPELLRDCAAHLHQLRGPLQILDVHGADLLAREMEQVIDALLQNMLEQPSVALELIMQALLQLPDYLSGLESGKQENPALLIPLVNSMRSVRSVQPLSESALFSPDLSATMPVSVFDVQSAAASEDAQSIAREGRRRFQAGLLEWFRAGTGSNGLQALFDVLEHLQASAASEQVARLWWVSAGVVEALSTGVLEESPEIKRLFGLLDRQIKYLADKGEAAVADQLPADLFRGLLYQLAGAGNCEGRIDMIKETYRLDESLPSGADNDSQAGYLDSCRDDLLQTVSVNLRDEIGRIKDQLNDIHQHAQNNPAVLASLAHELHMLVNTLDMVGMDALCVRLADQEHFLTAAADANSAIDESMIADLTDTLTVVEDMLSVTGDDPVPADECDSAMTNAGCLQEGGVGEPDEAEDELPVLSANADPEIVEIYLEEAAEEIESLSQVLPAWLDNPVDRDSLEAIRRSFHTLKGSGRMAGAMLAGEFSWAIEKLLSKVLDGSVEPDGPVLDLLGQVLEALAQLMEQIGGGSPPASDIQALMARAEVLASGDSTGSRDESSGDDADIEPALIDIFTSECREHLQSIKDFLATGTSGSLVTEPVFRALHTITGISKTAEATSINMLATDLYRYFDELYQLELPLYADGFVVLRECTEAIDRLLQDDPGGECDAARLSVLRENIASLPASNREQVAVACDADADGAGVVEGLAEPEAVDADTSEMAGAGGAPVIDNDSDGDPYADMDPELVEIFIEEASEIIDSSENTLRDWTADPNNSDLQNEFQRLLHTLKGGARMVNISAIGDLSHALESLLTQVVDGHVVASESLFSLLVDVHDGLAGMLEQVRQRQLPAPAVDLLAALGRIGEEDDPDLIITADAVETEPLPKSAPEVESVPETEPGPQAKADTKPGQPVEKAPAAESARAVHNAAVIEKAVLESHAFRPEKERRKRSRVRGEQVRVPAGLLDDMVNLSGEITIYRSRVEQQVSDYRFNLNELEQTIGRLHEQLRQMEIETDTRSLFRFEQEADEPHREFDPLEMDRYSNVQQLSRSMIESISDLRSISDLMDGAIRDSEALLLQQSRASTKLQDGLIRTRMIPFAELAPRLRRVLRQAAQALGKKADLELKGAEGEIDRTVVERIIAPLEHMLRNAMAHGIETPAQRGQAGKPETGTVTISLQREGSEIVLRIADDGAGIDLEAIKSRALERGLLAADADLSDNDIMQFILQTGFSTAGEVTQISGRGVGMDVVNSEVKQLGGSLQIDSSRGRGTDVTMRLPYTLAINQALLVRAGDETFCIPLVGIEGVLNIETAELMACHEAGEGFEYAGNSYRLQHLGTLLGTGSMEEGQVQALYPVLLVRVGNKRMALQVDALMGSREIVIKPLGAQLSTVDGITGATILGDGRVVLILDLAAVSRMNGRVQPEETGKPAQTAGQLVVMVVDDSITVRKVTTRLLERKGFRVLSAKDGVDAMGQLQENIPDIVLLDVEMPRMDGFELATHIRNDERLRTIPIVMITSRTGDKHRERARQIGVNSYLGKPYQENDLLKSIYTLMGISTEATVT